MFTTPPPLFSRTSAQTVENGAVDSSRWQKESLWWQLCDNSAEVPEKAELRGEKCENLEVRWERGEIGRGGKTGAET